MLNTPKSKVAPLKIALTGAHGTGKTTLLNQMATTLRIVRQVVQLPEVPRLIIEQVGNPAFFQRGHNTPERQFSIIASQIEVEASFARSKTDLILCDRTVADHWIYTCYLFPELVGTPEFKVWENLVMRWLDSYELIIKLPIEFPPENDGVREPDPLFQSTIDQMLTHFYHNNRFEVFTVCGSIETRLGQSVELVMRRSLVA